MKQLSMYDQEFSLAHQGSSFQDSPSEQRNSKSKEAKDVQPAVSCKYLKIHPDHASNKDATLNNDRDKAAQAFTPNVTEIVLTRDKVDSIQLILPMLINLHQEKRWLAWIDPPIQLLKEWQKAHNEKALNQIMILRSSDSFSVFELSKRALEAGTCHAVIAWTNNLNQEEFSRLEEASSYGNSHGIILRSRSM